MFAFTKDYHAYAVSLRFANGAVGTLNTNDGRSFAIPTEEVEISARDGCFMTVHNSSSWRITERNQPSEWREPPTFTSLGDSGRDPAKTLLNLPVQDLHLALDPALPQTLPDRGSNHIVIHDVFHDRHMFRLPFYFAAQPP